MFDFNLTQGEPVWGCSLFHSKKTLTLIWVGFLGVRFEVGGKMTPSLV